MLVPSATALVLSSAILVAAAPSQKRNSQGSISGGGTTNHGAVATEVNICSQVGIDVLKQDGSAADAVSSLPS